MASYDTMEISPLNKPRKTTNRITLVFFIIFMVAYVGVGIYAFVNGDAKKIDKPNQDVKNILDKLDNSKWLIFGNLVVSIVLTLVCLAIVRGISRFIIRVAIVLECLNLVYYFILLIALLIHFNAAGFIAELIVTLFVAWGVYVKVYVVQKVGTKLMSLVVKESCRAVFHFPSTIALGILTTVLIFVVIIFGISIYMNLSTIAGKSSFVMGLLHFVNIYSTIWLTLALGALAQTVSCGTFGSWYWNRDKNTLPDDAILQHMGIAFRYHLGTIAYLSTPLIIFVIIWTMIKNWVTRTYESRHNIFVLIVCWFNILTRIFDSTIAANAIHGEGFTKAADTVCQIYLRFPVLLYAVSKASEWCLGVMVGISVIVVTSLSAIFLSPTTNEETIVAVGVIVLFLIIVILPLILILYSAVATIFYCILEDYERCQEDRSRSCFMKLEIKELMMEVE